MSLSKFGFKPLPEEPYLKGCVSNGFIEDKYTVSFVRTDKAIKLILDFLNKDEEQFASYIVDQIIYIDSYFGEECLKVHPDYIYVFSGEESNLYEYILNLQPTLRKSKLSKI